MRQQHNALAANGIDDAGSSSPATIFCTPTGTFDMGTSPINLTWTAGGNTIPSKLFLLLCRPQGTLKLNGNVIAVNNASATPLGTGFYSLIRVSDGYAGTITGTPNSSVVVTGAGLALNTTASIHVGSVIGDASDVDLIVSASSTTVTIAPPAAVNRGTAPNIVVTVSPDPSAEPGGGGTVQFYTNGVAIVSLPIRDGRHLGGTATFADALFASLAAGTSPVTAIYSGSTDTLIPGGSSPSFQYLVKAGINESIAYWDNNGTSPAGSGTWDTTSADWGLSAALSANTVKFPSGANTVFTTSANALSTITVNSAITIGALTNSSTGASNVFSGTGSFVINAGSPVTPTTEFTAANAQNTIAVPITGNWRTHTHDELQHSVSLWKQHLQWRDHFDRHIRPTLQ